MNLIDHHSAIDIKSNLDSDNTLFTQHGVMNKCHTVGTISKLSRTSLERGKIYTPNTHPGLHHWIQALQ